MKKNLIFKRFQMRSKLLHLNLLLASFNFKMNWQKLLPLLWMVCLLQMIKLFHLLIHLIICGR